MVSAGAVVRTTHAAHRGLNPGFCQTLGITDRRILHSAIAVMHQTICIAYRSVVERLFQRISASLKSRLSANGIVSRAFRMTLSVCSDGGFPFE